MGDFAKLLEVNPDRYKHWEYGTKPPEKVMDKVREMVINFVGTVSGLQGKSGALQLIERVPRESSDSWAIDEEGNCVIDAPIEFSNEKYEGAIAGRGEVSLLPMVHPGDLLVFRRTKTALVGKVGAIAFPGAEERKTHIGVVTASVIELRNSEPIAPEDLRMPHGNWDYLGVLVGLASSSTPLRVGPIDSGLSLEMLARIFADRSPANHS